MKNVLVSIITVVFNGEKTIEKTIKSVLNQSYSNIEYLIIDGGSTDSTVDIITKYESKLSYWVSEKDQGIADAFNKGIQKARGEIIGIINADDWYEKDAVKSIVSEYTGDNEIICAKIKLWNTDKLYKIKTSTLDGIEKQMKIWHPGVFVPRKVYSGVGLYDINIKILMDYDFVIRCMQHNVKFKFIDACISNMKSGGISNRLIYKSMKESLNIKNNYFGRRIKNFIEYVYFLCYYSLLISVKDILYKREGYD
ncbi:MAG TPA: glycosyltransferase family 2 protein [Bacteroidales bacterium]